MTLPSLSDDTLKQVEQLLHLTHVQSFSRDWYDFRLLAVSSVKMLHVRLCKYHGNDKTSSNVKALSQMWTCVGAIRRWSASL